MRCIENSIIISFEITSLILVRPNLNATIQSVGANNNAPEMVLERSAMIHLSNYSISIIRVSGRLFIQRTHDWWAGRTFMEPVIRISSTVQPYEDAEKILQSIKMFFPDCEINEIPGKGVFPTKNKEQIIHGTSSTFDILLNQIRIQRILDTALDVMTINSDNSYTYFLISRQAAITGKVSFVVDEGALGGMIRIEISGEDIDIWLEQQTWHEGRNEFPRFSGDELAMRRDGEPTEWFDKRGNPTINIDED
ncbi:MAG: hypothetical protein DBX07_07815 [Candidatus Poseidoniales archaeon]|nr:hypothetical protein [Euryarchaeota archaeon]OUX46818.1 MAG: hypothetical protein CBE40_01440 [Euryarchaeota archaeon TMED280]RCH72853.1 MAG: hypothetical protein DBX07_07815 [Candidatus Poseidoniales archaeon]